MATSDTMFTVSFNDRHLTVTHIPAQENAARSARVVSSMITGAQSQALFVTIGSDAAMAAMCLASSGYRVAAIAPNAGDSAVFISHITQNGLSGSCRVYDNAAAFLADERDISVIDTLIAGSGYAPVAAEILAAEGVAPRAVFLETDSNIHADHPAVWLCKKSYVTKETAAPDGYLSFVPSSRRDAPKADSADLRAEISAILLSEFGKNYDNTLYAAVFSALTADISAGDKVYLQGAKQAYDARTFDGIIVPVIALRKERDKAKANFIGMEARAKRASETISALEAKQKEAQNLHVKTDAELKTAAKARDNEAAAASLLKQEITTLKTELSDEKKAYKSATERERDLQRKVDEFQEILSKHADTGVSKLAQKMKNIFAAPLAKAPDASSVTDMPEENENANISRSAFGPSSLKVAAVMDEFTYECYRRECTLKQLLPDDVEAQLEAFAPDMFFIESAWQGRDGAWKLVISTCAEPIQRAIAWCKAHDVPVMFWNKEDPVHFGSFIAVAGMVDHVFTTDVDCVPLYKERLGHDNVSLLLFAAQPATHNPIELFDREDAFSFAGSYYLRYPQRQRDFKALIDAAKTFKPVRIYDRNSGNDHPHYKFPDTYKDMLLPCLPFAEIDKAYKGYRFGINMNTIKQSQTMFARRAYELLASNTPTISNFSRGVCNVLADLVLCSDNAEFLSRRIKPLCEDDTYYRKFRLLGLRRVMQQHSYRQRLDFISRRVLKKESVAADIPVLLLADAPNKAALDAVITSLSRQNHAPLSLHIVTQATAQSCRVYANAQNIFFYKSAGERAKKISALYQEAALAGYLHPDDYYGANYITDAVTALYYSDANIIGKAAYYTYLNGRLTLAEQDKAYHRITEGLTLRRAFLSCRVTDAKTIAEYLSKGAETAIQHDNMLAIDEFNYCKGAAAAAVEDYKETCDDITDLYPGIDVEDACRTPEGISYRHMSEKDAAEGVKALEGDYMADLLKRNKFDNITVTLRDKTMVIDSTLADDKHAYIYLPKVYTRKEFCFIDDSEFLLDVAFDAGEIKTVFVFLDKDRKKISHAINPCHGSAAKLAIPYECAFVKFGFRVMGSGAFSVNKLLLGSSVPMPSVLMGASRYLVVTKQYPSYEDIYKYGFLHTRVRAYKDRGLQTDVFRFNRDPKQPFREFEGVNVINGDAELLDSTLARGHYTHVLVHIMDKRTWDVVSKYLDTVKVTVWAHGAEIQLWQRRQYEFPAMNEQQIARTKSLSDERKKFWCNFVFADMHKNLSMVFVSNYLYQQTAEDFGVTIPDSQKHIIHNYINANVFAYHPKPAEQRFKCLSIRPYVNRTYANDVTVQAIVLMSKKKKLFAQMEFTLYGDGPLFEQTTEPLKKFKNVKLIKKFLTHANIAKVHREHGIFLTPTRMDTQGVSRDEAMASGLVPITTAVAAVPEFVDESCGRVVPAEDTQAIADAMEELVNNPELFLQLSAAAAKRVRDTLSCEQTVQKEIDLIVGK